jgi:hypothetical protein
MSGPSAPFNDCSQIHISYQQNDSSRTVCIQATESYAVDADHRNDAMMCFSSHLHVFTRLRRQLPLKWNHSRRRLNLEKGTAQSHDPEGCPGKLLHLLDFVYHDLRLLTV